MRWGRWSSILVGLMTVWACGKSADRSSMFEDVRADLNSRAAYHVSAVVRAPGPLASALDGTYEIDYEKPDRYRTVRLVASEEAGRTVAIGADLVSSDDKGRSWQHATVGAGAGFSGATLLGLLDSVCSVTRAGSRVEVSVRSRTRGCDKPLKMSVDVSGGVIRSIETKMPTDLGSMTISARFDLQRAVEPIVKPAETRP
jgi:hypothetical protein